MHMDYKQLFTRDEIEFIKEKYPNVDVDNLDLPALGMSSVTSLDLLKASIKSDIEYKNFDDCVNPLIALKLCSSINQKLNGF